MRTKSGWSLLAGKLTVDRRTIDRWRNLKGAPATPDEAKWREFCAANDLGHGGTAALRKLREEKLTEEIALLKFKRQQAEGELVSVAAMEDFVGRFSLKLDQLLTQKIETELPVRMQGKDIVAMRAEARAMHDEVREIYNAGLLEWQPEQTAATEKE